MKRTALMFCLALVIIPFSTYGIERRQDQFPKEPSYLIIPMPYSLPGIGAGITLTGLATNIAGTYADLFGIAYTGDAKGTILGAFDIHLVPKTLVLDLFVNIVDSVSQQYYEERGMSADKNDFTYQELDKFDYRDATLTLMFFDRRLELFGGLKTEAANLIRIKDNHGDVLFDYRNDPIASESESAYLGFVLDYTDDRSDPRIGVRLQADRSRTAPDDNDDADYYVDDIAVTAYFPVLEASTWAFHILTSDAVVTRRGLRDPDLIAEEIGCDSYVDCTDEGRTRIDSIFAARKYGNARSLGGDELLRSYPGGRFSGAHMLYYSTEFRWNFLTGVTPINFWIWKDIATSMQLAFFHEVGGVAESKEKLGGDTRWSSGVGFRLVAASGVVYRADYAFSDDESATTLIVSYPW